MHVPVHALSIPSYWGTIKGMTDSRSSGNLKLENVGQWAILENDLEFEVDVRMDQLRFYWGLRFN